MEKKFKCIYDFYASADVSMVIASCMITACILMSLAIFAQGYSDTIFLQGIQLWNSPSSTRVQEEKDRDDAEKEVFESGPSKRSPGSADAGVETFMKSSAPTITWCFLGSIVVFSAYHAATTQP